MSYSVITLAGGGFAYFDGSLTTPQEVFPSPRVEYPFPGDQLTRVIRRRYHVLASSYCPAALDQTDSVYTLAYLVSDIPVQELPGGVWEIERVFAEVPVIQQEWESYVFAFPGLAANVASITGVPTTLTGAAYCPTTGILSWSSPSVITGQVVVGRVTGEWSYNYTGGNFIPATRQIDQTFQRAALSPTAVDIGIRFTQGPRPSVVGTSGISASAFTEGSIALSRRNPIQLAGVSRIEDIYFLAGTSSAAAVSQPSDIETLQQFSVSLLYGALETETIGFNTLPNLTEYSQMVATESEIVAEESRVERYLGNIYRRRTRYMKAK